MPFLVGSLLLIGLATAEDGGYLARLCADHPNETTPNPAELRAQLNSNDQDERLTAADLLACHGEAARPAVPEMIALFASSSGEAQANAVGAVAYLGEIAVPALIEALDDPNERVRDNVCRAIKKIGPGARSALPALQAPRQLAVCDPALLQLAVERISAPE